MACEQIGRWWAANTSLASATDGLGIDWDFCEPTETSAGQNIFAVAMPALEQRKPHAASLTPEPTAETENRIATRSIGVRVLATGKSKHDAEMILADLMQLISPSNAGFRVNAPSVVSGYEGMVPSGVIGEPAATAGQTTKVWRFHDIEVVGGPYAIPGGGAAGTNQTNEGQHLAAMTLRALCVEAELTGSP